MYDHVIIICHSNGTLVSWKSIEQMYKKNDNIILCAFGGIIKCSYDFRLLYKKVKLVLNHCSTHDNVVRLLPRLVGAGSSGFFGFKHRGKTDANIKEMCEPVWVPISESNDFPYVMNIRYPEKPSHSEWIEKIKYIVDSIRHVEKYLSHKK